MVPTYLPTSRHLGFEGLGSDYPGADYGLRGWDLGAPQAPPAPPASGGWATASTSPPQAPHAVEETDRTHEDSVGTSNLTTIPNSSHLLAFSSLLCVLIHLFCHPFPPHSSSSSFPLLPSSPSECALPPPTSPHAFFIDLP